jgi:hypothetical protein
VYTFSLPRGEMLLWRIFFLLFLSRFFLLNNIKYFVEGIYLKRPTLFNFSTFSVPYPPTPASQHRLLSTSYTENRKTLYFCIHPLMRDNFCDFLTPTDAAKENPKKFWPLKNITNPTGWEGVKNYQSR